MLFAIQLCIELCNRSKDSNYDLLRSQEYIQVQEFLDNEMRLVNELDCQQTANNILLEERMIEQYRGICTEVKHAI